MTDITYHIRAPKPGKGKANAFYSEHEPRFDKTLCDALPTEHDQPIGWQPYNIGRYVPCAACCQIRRERQRAARKKLTRPTP
jgi:hypothetical protein